MTGVVWKADAEPIDLEVDFGFSPEEARLLKKDMDNAHLEIWKSPSRDGKIQFHLDFNGTQNVTDGIQDILTATGFVGPVCEASVRIARKMANKLQTSPNLEFGSIVGFSMGGG